ncbi:uncharacterized protein LOC119436066 isoform X1 [Dermacentor silvarum]|uniref:uncharacterized protein LOC119436066 isoform X1 n=1 Tax=Dermacentor silvarum TaxID=543639 RepID=UPI0018991FE2|nr:uncharacterized protein LOC119436066 isoform X1 [Dermacentor silvarum]
MYYHIENSALRCMESLEPKTPSWTENDLLVLITEYWKRKDILRAKASESVTNLQKRECWIEITDVVNARCFTPHTRKTMDQLKRKWEKTIMLAKKAALNIQKRSGNLSDLAPAYQLALSIVCEDFPASLECANGLAAADVPSLAEPPNAGGYIDEVSSMVITELEEESSGDGPPVAKGDKTQSVKAEMLSEAAECAPHSLGSRAFQPVLSGSSTQDGATDGNHQHHQPHEAQDATAEFVNNFRKRKWEQDLVELQKEKVRRQIQYHKVQHELQMSVLRSQMEFWEMKKSKLAAEIRQGGIPTLLPMMPSANASTT